MPAPVAVAPVAAPNAPSAVPANVAVAPKAAAPVNGAPPAAQAAEQTFEVKVGGEVRKYTRTEAERLLSRLGYADQTVKQAKEALKAAAQARQEREEEDADWSDDSKLEERMRKRGRDPDAFARKILERKLSEAQMTPEQREASQLKEQLAERDQRLKALEEEGNQRKLTENAKRIQAKMEDDLTAAADKRGLARDQDTFFAVYEVVKEFRKLGLPFDAEQIVDTAAENIDGGFKRLESAVLKGLKGKPLYDRLGKSVVDELNRYQVELLRAGGAKAAAPTQTAPKAATSGYVTPQEMAERMRRGGR